MSSLVALVATNHLVEKDWAQLQSASY